MMMDKHTYYQMKLCEQNVVMELEGLGTKSSTSSTEVITLKKRLAILSDRTLKLKWRNLLAHI